MPSVRSRSRYKSRSSAIVYQTPSFGGKVPVSKGSITVRSELESMVDSLTANFHKRVGRAMLPQNPLTYSCQLVVNEVGSIDQPGNTGQWYTWSGPLCGLFNGTTYFGTPTSATLPSYVLADLVAKAKFECLSRFDRPSYSFGETIAEFKNTISTIKEPMLSVSKLLSRFRKERDSNLKKYALGSKDLAGLWKNYSFGIGPLVGSASDAVDAFHDRYLQKPSFRTVYGYAAFEPEVLIRESGSLSLSGWVSTRKSRRTLSVKVKAGFSYSVTDPSTTKSLLGLRARDLPGTAWELVPLSFMVDRVINVKRFVNISSSLLSSNVSIGGGFVTTRVSDTIKYQHTDIRQGTNPARKWSPSDAPPGYIRTFSLGRSKWSPSIVDAVPSFDNRLFDDIHSTLDVISLVLGRFKFRLK